MKKIVLIHLIALILALICSSAKALDCDVDWPTSDGTTHTLAITINGCQTLFKIKNKDFNSFSKSDEALQQALEKAIDRANNGCK